MYTDQKNGEEMPSAPDVDLKRNFYTHHGWFFSLGLESVGKTSSSTASCLSKRISYSTHFSARRFSLAH
jgi:hypothetical protein